MRGSLLYAPESPAINTFSRPIFFPLSVNGLLLGILILGITSCGALPLSINSDPISRSSSPLETIAWLATSSKYDPASEFLRESGLLMMDAGAGDPKERGVKGLDIVAWEDRR